ncbi:MAG: ketoacyl-ACP synthase III, partial [Proteobacteria bacterium]
GGYRNGTTPASFEVETDEKENVKHKLQLSMDGARVFDFTLREITPSIERLVEKSGVEKARIDYFLLHQSNRFIINQIAMQLGVSTEKMLLNIEKFGNTSGVSIPLLMSSHREKFDGKPTVAFSGYGVGLNWANAIVQNLDADILETVEI